MNIIVVGIGKVGYTVAEQLATEMHDVTVIDTNYCNCRNYPLIIFPKSTNIVKY